MVASVRAITAGGHGTGASDAAVLTGFGITAVGTVLMWKGAQDRRKATNPQTAFGVFTGRATGVQLRRSW